MKERVRNWFARIQETKQQNKEAKEKLKSLREDVNILADQIYNTPPLWKSQICYQIVYPVAEWQVYLPSLGIFYPELAGEDLVAIFIAKDSKSTVTEFSTAKPKLDISLFFGLVDSRINFIVYSNKTQIRARLKQEPDPTIFAIEKENKAGGISGEILRLSLIKEVLSMIQARKRTAQTI